MNVGRSDLHLRRSQAVHGHQESDQTVPDPSSIVLPISEQSATVERGRRGRLSLSTDGDKCTMVNFFERGINKNFNIKL